MHLHYKQRTLAKSISCSGVGTHSGKNVNLKIKPAPINHGIKFIRTDLPGKPCISAHFNMVVDTSQATVIGNNGVIISTIEHLMAAFAGLSIDNAIVELNAYEMPIMDGSAEPFTLLLKKAGLKEQPGPRCYFILKKPIKLIQDGRSVCAYPSESYKITCTIEYNSPLIKKQTYTIELSDGIFEKEISSARTFGFLHEYNHLKRYGLARGSSLDNVVVIDKDNILNKDGLRFKNEFVRHKILDCIGDLSLLGLPIIGHIILNKSGHAFNYAFLEKFFSQKESWETRTINKYCALPDFHPKALAI